MTACAMQPVSAPAQCAATAFRRGAPQARRGLAAELQALAQNAEALRRETAILREMLAALEAVGARSAASAALPAAQPVPESGRSAAADGNGAPRFAPGFGAAASAEAADAIVSRLSFSRGERFGEGSITLVLSPATLGGSTVSVSAADGVLSVVVASESPETAELVSRSIPALDRALCARTRGRFRRISVSVKKGSADER